MLPTISIEDHFISEAVRSSQLAEDLALHMFPEDVRTNIIDIGDGRVQNLDRGGVSLQVISSIPCLESAEVCRQTNNQLAKAVQQCPSRFAGFACLRMGDPKAAVTELEYCCRELGFLGVLIPDHAAGVHYDGDDYLPFWEKAQELDKIVYIHPAPPSAIRREYFRGNYPPEVAQIMSMQVWGWHADVGTHVLRLYASGLLDKVPKLKIVVGHMGEMLPFMKERIQATMTQNWATHKPGWLTVWEENFWFTTSMFDMTAMSCLLRAAAVDRIMYSVDYPLVDIMEGRKFIEDLQNSGMVTGEEMERIAFRNAEQLLGIKLGT